MSSTSKTVARNSLFILIARGMDAGIGMLLIWVSARYLLANFGVDVNGKYAYVIILIGLVFSLANAGLAQIVIRDVAVDKSLAPSYLRASLILRLLLGILCSVIIFLLANYLPITRGMKYGLLIAIVSEMLNVVSANYISLFNAFERMDYEAIATIIFRSVCLALTLLIVWLKWNWVWLFVVTATGNFLRLAYVLWISRSIVTPAPNHDWERVKTIFVSALPIGISVLLTQGYLRIDGLIIQRYSLYREIAYFYYPYQILLQLNIFPLALTTALFPVLSRAGQSNDIENIFVSTFKLYFILSLPIMVFGFLYASPIITTLFTDAFARSGTCLQILIWSTFFVFVELLMNHSLIATGRQSALYIGSGTCLVVNASVDFILIKYYHLGAVGASIGTISSYVALFLVLLYFVSQTVSLKKILQQIPRPLCAGLFCGLIFYPFRGYLWYLMIPLGLLVYIAILFIIRTFTEKEINMFRSLLRPPGPVRT